MSQQLKISRALSINILILLIQYVGLSLSTLTKNPTLFWFASGTSVAFIFLRGNIILPGLWLGSFIALIFQTTFLIACVAATLFILPAVCLWQSNRYITHTLVFARVNIYLYFVMGSAVLTAVTTFLLCKLFSMNDFLIYWLANWYGLLIVSMAIAAWDYYFPDLQDFSFSLLNSWFGVVLMNFMLGVGVWLIEYMNVGYLVEVQIILISLLVISGSSALKLLH